MHTFHCSRRFLRSDRRQERNLISTAESPSVAFSYGAADGKLGWVPCCQTGLPSARCHEPAPRVHERSVSFFLKIAGLCAYKHRWHGREPPHLPHLPSATQICVSSMVALGNV